MGVKRYVATADNTINECLQVQLEDKRHRLEHGRG